MSARKVVVYEFICLDGVAEDVARFFTEFDDEEVDAAGGSPSSRRRWNCTSTYRTHPKETTMTAMFVNLPVTDLDRARAFYTAIGFTFNPLMSDHNSACIAVEDGHSYFMLLLREYFQTFTDRPIADPATTALTATAIFVETREAVDTAVTQGLAAGGTEAQPATDYGFMYQRQLTDPDGHVLEFGYMDPAAAQPGPEAQISQQA